MTQSESARKILRVRRHFRQADPLLFPVLANMKLEPLRPLENTGQYFAKLCREIISQQLGNGAAHAIVDRFFALFPGCGPTPTRVAALPEKDLRRVGMSWAKARYLGDLAAKTAAGELDFKKLPGADDETVIDELTKVKGIGRWTAEMFLIFTLGREDIFSYGDLGLRKGFARLYGERRASSPEGMERVVRQWTPYRSYASLALWHISDAE